MRVSRRRKNIIYGIIGLVGVMMATLLIKLLSFSGLFALLLTLNGVRAMEMEVNTNFQDPGAQTRLRFSDYSDEAKAEGNLSTKELGTYTLTYTFDKYQKTVERKVSVIDTTPPKIDLEGDSSTRVFENGSFQEPGYQTSDDCDGDVSRSVEREGSVNMRKQDMYTSTYIAGGASGNITSVKRSVRVCTGPANTKLYYDHDSYDNTTEEWWFDKGEDHRWTAGAKDEKLLKKYGSYHQGPREKVIYPTFDKGGSDITYIKQIMEALKKSDVQATYLLTRNCIKTEANSIRQPVQDGNVIGNHSRHHYDMTTLANVSSIDEFVAEIAGIEKTYMEVTGQPVRKIFRFPEGGSSEHAMKLVKDLGYSNCSWSHVYYDYASDVSGSEALKTAMEYYHEGVIYLLHPNSRGNYEAMDAFVKNMKDLGYDPETVGTTPSDAQEK